MAQEIRIQSNGKSHAKNLSFLFNGKRGSTVAHKTKKKKKSGKRNPFYGQHRGKTKPHRNPFREKRSGVLGSVETMLGGVAAFLIPELIEGSSFGLQFNSGLMGYLADAVIGGLIMWGGGKWIGRGFSDGALTGIVVKITARASQDVGATAHGAISANIRDAQAAAAAAPQPAAAAPGQMSGVGRPVAWNFPIPASYKALPSGGFAQNISLSGVGRAVPMRPLRRRVV